MCESMFMGMLRGQITIGRASSDGKYREGIMEDEKTWMGSLYYQEAGAICGPTARSKTKHAIESLQSILPNIPSNIPIDHTLEHAYRT